MNKKSRLAILALLTIGLSSFLTTGIPAQNADSAGLEKLQRPCSGNVYKLPSLVPVGNDALRNYIKIAALPAGKKQQAFSEASNEDKAQIFKIHLALQFMKRPDLNKDQKDLIMDVISKVSTATYDRSTPEKRGKIEQDESVLEERALSVFPSRETYEIFADLGGSSTDLEILQKYEEAISLPTMAQRQKLFRETTPLERSNLWKTQMIYYLATAKFNKAQQDFVLEVIALSTPRAFDFPRGGSASRNEETKTMDALETKAFNLFSKEEVFAFFMNLGIHKLPVSRADQTQGYVIEEPTPSSPCSCRWLCFGCFECKSGGCTETPAGCGLFLNSPCTSRCENMGIMECSTQP